MVFKPTLVVDGEVAGIWRRQARGRPGARARSRPSSRSAAARWRDVETAADGIRPLPRAAGRGRARRGRTEWRAAACPRRRCRRATASTPNASVCRRAGPGGACATTSSSVSQPGLTADEVDRMLAGGRVRRRRRAPGASRRAVRAAVGGVGPPRPARRGGAARATSSVLHRDERLVVVDKPHHMATMPRGRHVVQSALARARVLTGLPRLTPAAPARPADGGRAHVHDGAALARRLPAGLRGGTGPQDLPRGRAGARRPRAAARAPHPPRQGARHPPGPRGAGGAEPNAETLVELRRHRRASLGLYRLTPRTGRTHQLRCQLSRPRHPDRRRPALPGRPWPSPTTTSASRSSCWPPSSSSTTPSTGARDASRAGAGSTPGRARGRASVPPRDT